MKCHVPDLWEISGFILDVRRRGLCDSRYSNAELQSWTETFSNTPWTEWKHDFFVPLSEIRYFVLSAT